MGSSACTFASDSVPSAFDGQVVAAGEAAVLKESGRGASGDEV